MAREVKKTSQIGVRFDLELLEAVTLAALADSPQKALNLYEKSYLELVELKVKNINHQKQIPEDIEVIELPPEVITENKTTQDIPKKLSMKERIELEKEKLNTKK